MIYLPVQFYALCPVLSGAMLSFSSKCLIMPHTTLYVTTKKLSEETEQNPSELQPHWSNNILGLPSLSNLFWNISVKGHSHIQVASRDVQWTFMGGYLNYMYVLVCGNCLAKTYCFLPSIGQLAMPNFFSAKYMFAMVPTKEYSIQNSAFCLSQKL